MPWPETHLPKYRKHRASGQAVVTLNGRDHYLGPHGTKASKREYSRLLGEHALTGGSSSEGSAQDLTIVELCAHYLKFAKGYYKKGGELTGEVQNVKAAMRFLKDCYCKTPVCKFGPLAFKAVRQCMVEAGLSRTYINAQAGRIKRFFKWGVAEEMVPPAVYQGLMTVTGLRKGRSEARESEPVKPVDDITVEAILEHLPAIVADMVRLERLTGMRPAEVCHLRPCDIDQSDEVWMYRLESHKTEHHNRDRVVPIGPKAQAILLLYLARDTSMCCFRPCDSEAKRRAAARKNRKTPTSCGSRPGSNRKRKPKRTAGDFYTSCSYRRAIHRACDKAFPHPKLGYKFRSTFTEAEKKELREWQSEHHWSPNQLRHTAATEIRQKFGIEAAQIILGHSTADVTQVYAERDLAKGIEVARQIG